MRERWRDSRARGWRRSSEGRSRRVAPGRRQRRGTWEEGRGQRVGRVVRMFCARKEHCVGLVPRQPEREICAVMHVQVAFSAHNRIRDISGEGAGDVRAVEHVPIREHARLDRLLDRADVRPARSRPAVPSRGRARGQRERCRARCDWPLAQEGGTQARGERRLCARPRRPARRRAPRAKPPHGAAGPSKGVYRALTRS
jgi:hypothetical protein